MAKGSKGSYGGDQSIQKRLDGQLVKHYGHNPKTAGAAGAKGTAGAKKGKGM